MSARTQRNVSPAGGAREAQPVHAGSVTYLAILQEVTNAGISRAELGKAVGASERTVANWAQGATTPRGRKADRLLDVQLIVRMLGENYSPEGVRIWLNSRNRNLGLRRPMDMLVEGDSDAVLEEVSHLSEGLR